MCNYERSCKVGDEIGGHTVSGHIQTTATVRAITKTETNQRWSLVLTDPTYVKYILPKGFVAVNGCSLTVCEVMTASEDGRDGRDIDGSGFSIYLIPETLRVTTFGSLAVGDVVNIEVEASTVAIVDTVERVVAQHLATRGLS